MVPRIRAKMGVIFLALYTDASGRFLTREGSRWGARL
jgi:hypothetical protein